MREGEGKFCLCFAIIRSLDRGPLLIAGINAGYYGIRAKLRTSKLLRCSTRQKMLHVPPTACAPIRARSIQPCLSKLHVEIRLSAEYFFPQENRRDIFTPRRVRFELEIERKEGRFFLFNLGEYFSLIDRVIFNT